MAGIEAMPKESDLLCWSIVLNCMPRRMSTEMSTLCCSDAACWRLVEMSCTSYWIFFTICWFWRRSCREVGGGRAVT